MRAIEEDLGQGYAGGVEKTQNNPIQIIEQICLRFHVVARQLRSRHAGRATLDVGDEYDVQDLFPSTLTFVL